MYAVFRKPIMTQSTFRIVADTDAAWSEYGLGQPTNLSYAIHTYFNDSQAATYRGNT